MRQFWLGRAGLQVSIVVGRCGRMIYSELAETEFSSHFKPKAHTVQLKRAAL